MSVGKFKPRNWQGSGYRRQAASAASQRPASPSKFRKFWEGIDWMRLRCHLIALLILVAWFILWSRAAQLQLFKGEDYAARARRQHLTTEIVTFPRGMITDRNGLPLARSVQCRSIYANPGLVINPKETAETLSKLLKRPESGIHAQLTRNKQFVWVARHVSDAVSRTVADAELPGIVLTTEYERIYPYRHALGQLLGFVGMEGEGLEGLERALNDRLSGQPGRQFVQRDARGRKFHVGGSAPVDETEDVTLTIDLNVQSFTEEILAAAVSAEGAKWGGMLIIDVPTGDVLAWAQAPFFNPNHFRSCTPDTYRNRLALDALEPGSTFKPFLMAAAMREGLINCKSTFDCESGEWITRTITIRDDGRSFGKLPVNRIIAESSNIGSAKIGLLLGAPRFHSFLSDMGFGKRLGLPIPESKGILREPRDWGEADTMSAAFGQSISVTPVQMAQAYLTLANFGRYRPLRLVMDGHGQSDDGPRIFPENIAKEVLSVMREVVENGTGRRAALPGISIAGKTGTAQKADKHGKYGDARMASFVGIFPAEKPRTLIIVILDEPEKRTYGGQIAAPVFRKALTRLLAYNGELPELARPGKTDANDGPNITAERPAMPDGEGLIPDVIDRGVHQAIEQYARQGIVPVLQGEGNRVARQDPPAGSPIPDDVSAAGFQCTLWLKE